MPQPANYARYGIVDVAGQGVVRLKCNECSHTSEMFFRDLPDTPTCAACHCPNIAVTDTSQPA